MHCAMSTVNPDGRNRYMILVLIHTVPGDEAVQALIHTSYLYCTTHTHVGEANRELFHLDESRV